MNEIDFNFLSTKIETIIHAAAHYDLQASYHKCYIDNVLGTENLLNALKKSKKIKRLHYLSTIAVAGDYQGIMQESELTLGQNFSNNYAKSKYLAEKLVRDFSKILKTTIYRPGIVIGHSETGIMEKVDGPYYYFKSINKFLKINKINKYIKVLPLPYNKSSILPIIPVDELVKIITKAIEMEQNNDLETYHVITPKAPLVEEFIQEYLKACNVHTILIPVKYQLFGHLCSKILNYPNELVEFMYSKTQFSNDALNEKFGENSLKRFSEYKDNIFNWAINNEPKEIS